MRYACSEVCAGHRWLRQLGAEYSGHRSTGCIAAGGMQEVWMGVGWVLVCVGGFEFYLVRYARAEVCAGHRWLRTFGAEHGG